MIGMMILNFKMAWNAIRTSKLRSFLTMMAVIIGVAAYVVITTTVEGLKTQTTDDINELGGNLVAINSGKLFIEDEEGNRSLNFAGLAASPVLTQEDFEFAASLDGVDSASPNAIITASVKRNETPLDGALVIATNEQYPQAFNQNVEQGEFFDDDDLNRVVIGKGVVEELYGTSQPLGTKLTVRGESFTVVGVMEDFESPALGGPDLNLSVFIPFEAAVEVTGGTVLIDEIDLQLADGADADAIVAQLEEGLLELHNGEEEFTVSKQDDIIAFASDFLDVIKSAAQAISYVMLFVGAVVILLIMLIAVNERIREIGIRKSIGATNSNILWQFMIEAVVLSWTGSAIGIAVAFGVGFIIDATIDITPVYSIPTLVAVVSISTIIGTLAGLYPAWSAAKKDPIEALRHE